MARTKQTATKKTPKTPQPEVEKLAKALLEVMAKNFNETRTLYLTKEQVDQAVRSCKSAGSTIRGATGGKLGLTKMKDRKGVVKYYVVRPLYVKGVLKKLGLPLDTDPNTDHLLAALGVPDVTTPVVPPTEVLMYYEVVYSGSPTNTVTIGDLTVTLNEPAKITKIVIHYMLPVVILGFLIFGLVSVF